METSARNTFSGTVTAVTSSAVQSEVVITTASGNQIVTTITNNSRDRLGIAVGKKATALVKAPFVMLEKAAEPSPTSARNAFAGTVTGTIADEVVTEVNGTLQDGTPVCAVITTASAKKLGVEKGAKFIFFFKAPSPILVMD
ncbi:molybdenum-pterin binding protein [Oleidesulfovibrio alaskensis G20]|jgi:molybdate transport system regulatory protein|uniref:Molybdenum-pterin binding protein n=1 Tax=Oleidesulfovibrio alaskensis (strain ATCC BAA-1058 / DSM 17464 / G20) TaxID=207559 RepID=Q314H4_OLEA2|nr:TOBE domain-containing protein [Oleidesulfovibrio alaskensis]ABB37672.1 molybdenum-pterin binding protein [Oleidesulfovibrio alaskensis G20]MBG0774738.1 TOBE domain-containing protein [Oleidesulfovibrio alaskensis]